MMEDGDNQGQPTEQSVEFGGLNIAVVENKNEQEEDDEAVSAIQGLIDEQLSEIRQRLDDKTKKIDELEKEIEKITHAENDDIEPSQTDVPPDNGTEPTEEETMEKDFVRISTAFEVMIDEIGTWVCMPPYAEHIVTINGKEVPYAGGSIGSEEEPWVMLETTKKSVYILISSSRNKLSDYNNHGTTLSWEIQSGDPPSDSEEPFQKAVVLATYKEGIMNQMHEGAINLQHPALDTDAHIGAATACYSSLDREGEDGTHEIYNFKSAVPTSYTIPFCACTSGSISFLAREIDGDGKTKVTYRTLIGSTLVPACSCEKFSITNSLVFCTNKSVVFHAMPTNMSNDVFVDEWNALVSKQPEGSDVTIISGTTHDVEIGIGLSIDNEYLKVSTSPSGHQKGYVIESQNSLDLGVPISEVACVRLSCVACVLAQYLPTGCTANIRVVTGFCWTDSHSLNAKTTIVKFTDGLFTGTIDGADITVFDTAECEEE